MNLSESEQRVLRTIDGTEDIAPYLKPDSVLDLMRAAKKMQRENEQLLAWQRARLESADIDRAEIERLRTALQTIYDGSTDKAPPFRAIDRQQMRQVAKAALDAGNQQSPSPSKGE